VAADASLFCFSGQLLFASGTGSTAVVGRAATCLRSRCCSCQTKRDNRHQQHYLQLLHDFSPLHLDSVVVWRMEHPRDEPVGIGSCF
jgi:hypothetical protein